jgi:hypothetical protein
MTIYNFNISIDISNSNTSSFEDWYPLLANIYGIPSKSFDGYVSAVNYSDTTLIIHCYLIEDLENNSKLVPFKERYKDWNGYQKISITDAVKLHARVLKYNIVSIAVANA